MGKTYYTIDGALDGFGDVLLEQLRAGVVPDWLYPGIPRSSGDSRMERSATSGSDYFEAIQEAIRGELDAFTFPSDRRSAFFRVYVEEPFEKYAPDDPVMPPDPVTARVQRWESANLGPIMVRDGEAEFSLGPHVAVAFDEDGEPVEVSMMQMFGN